MNFTNLLEAIKNIFSDNFLIIGAFICFIIGSLLGHLLQKNLHDDDK